jgi:zinc/manganese transport system permease protein
VSAQLQVLFLPFLACLILTGIHVYLGIHVISRKVIFVDIALAQIAALGATVGFLLGYDPRSDGAYYLSLGFAILAAVIFALTRTKHERVPQEAVIGLAYATASATAILLADISPHGAEHLHDLLAGSIVWVTPHQIIKTAILYSGIGLFHFLFRKRFLLISLQPEKAYAQGISVRLWDFLFYLSFGVVITSSVQIAGVLLVFTYLVAPSVFAVMFFDDLRRRLLTGWVMAALVSAVGLFFSYDRPSGPTIMVCFAVALLLGGTLRGILQSPRRGRALAIALGTSVALVAVAVGLYESRPTVSGHAAEEEAASLDAGAHQRGTGVQDWRAALRDSHDNIRVQAVEHLAASGDPRILPDLVDALHDQSASVREAAALALGDLRSRAAMPALLQALRAPDEDEWVRLRVAQAVVAMGEPQAIPVLLDLARNGEGRITRMEALRTAASVAGMEHPPSDDPNAEASQALLDRIEQWWHESGTRLQWDASAGRFRP